MFFHLFFTKRNNFIDFLFASVEEEVLPKEFHCLRKEFGPKEANSSLKELASFEKGMVRWSKVLGKFSVLGHPTNLDSRARAYCACSRCRWGMFGHFFSLLSFFFSFSLSGRWPDID